MPDQWMRNHVWARDHGICGICDKKADSDNWHLSHDKAKSLGGGDNQSNLFVAHPRCNLFMGPLNRAQGRAKLKRLLS